MAAAGKPKPHAVLIPYPAQGHIAPILRLAKLLHSRGFFITFVNTEFNHNRLIRSRGPKSVAGLEDFRFTAIPDGLPPSDKDATQDIPQLCDSLGKNGLPPFLELVKRLNNSPEFPPVSCIVSDGVMSFTLDAAEELGIPEVVFFTTSACGFMCYCNYIELLNRGLFPLKDEQQLTNGYLETEVDWVPGMPKNIRLRDFPTFIRTTNPEEIMVHYNILQTKNASRARAVILNTFDDLEPDVLIALRDKHDVVSTIGPLQLLERRIHNHSVKSISYSLWKEDTAAVDWLNSKPPKSVLYVNFGSITVLTHEQLLEFAWGLANSGKYFLWIVRPDLVTGESAILPGDFLTEVAARGLMVGWCEQEEVLAHPAVGVFLTHCGWNSIMEAVAEGVPMICWPFFAEQQTNCRYICRDWGTGVEIEGGVERGKVAAMVKAVMDEEKGKEMRDRAAEWKKKARSAVEDGGASAGNLDFIINEILRKN